MTTGPAVYLTTEEVAAKLRITTREVSRLRREEGLPNVGRIGLRTLHIEAAVDEWMAQRGKETTE